MKSREVIVSFACNHPEDGMWRGRATNAHWAANKAEFEFDHDDWGNGVAISVDDKLMTLKIHRISFPFKRRIPWHGNWCWEGFVMKRPAAIRLLKAMRDNGKWHCTCAPARCFEWFNEKQPA